MPIPRIHWTLALLLFGVDPFPRLEGAERPNVRLLSRIDVRNFGSEQLRIGDLDGDGGPDLLLVQSQYFTRKITCLTAVTLFGKMLWQVGEPSLDNGLIYSDLPVQIYDWDQDGRNEVLYVRQAKYLDPWNRPDFSNYRRKRERAFRYEGQATMVVLDGKTGREKAVFPLPAGADDCFLFADLTGRSRREDLVVKDRYWNVWGIAHDGKVLWHWAGSTGHFPAIADLDHDGRDEVFFGFTLLDEDGKVLFCKQPAGADWDPNRLEEPADRRAFLRFLKAPIHSDANYIVRLKDGSWRLLFGNTGPHCLAAAGTELWHDAGLGEAQHVVAGHFRPDSEYQVAIIDRTPRDQKRDFSRAADFYLYDLDGKRLWKQRQEKGDWMIGCTTVNWDGPGTLQKILLYGRTRGQPAQILDGDGKIVAELPLEAFSAQPAQDSSAKAPYGVENFYPLAADVWGDSREEVILFGTRGLCIYTNPRPSEIPTLYNETLYPGM
jgi:hypothetical protein